MMSLRGKLTTLACHPTKFVNKAEKRTFLPTNIAIGEIRACFKKYRNPVKALGEKGHKSIGRCCKVLVL